MPPLLVKSRGNLFVFDKSNCIYLSFLVIVSLTCFDCVAVALRKAFLWVYHLW